MARLIWLVAALCCACTFARAQTVVVLVNDEPITTYDVAQRMRWMSRTSGFGERMKAALQSDAIKTKFREMMIAANPRSQAEAEAAAERIKKQLIEDTKRRVLNEAGGGTRKAAIEALIEEKLKLQAAKREKITVTDSEVEESLAQRVGGSATGAAGKAKVDLSDFYKQFEADGVSRKAIQDIIRAQLAWRDVVRRQYGPRIASAMAAIPDNDKKTSDSDIQFDVRVLKLAVKSPDDQAAVSKRILEAENLKEKFQSCAELPKQAKLVPDTSVKAMPKATLASFPSDVQQMILKVSEGQMTPPVLVGNAVETYAICKKSVIAKANAKPDDKGDQRQAEYERFSKRYLQELKQTASIDYKGT